MFHPWGRDQGGWTIILYPSLGPCFLRPPPSNKVLNLESTLKPEGHREKRRNQKWRQSPCNVSTNRSYKKIMTEEVIIHHLRVKCVCEKAIPPPSWGGGRGKFSFQKASE